MDHWDRLMMDLPRTPKAPQGPDGIGLSEPVS